MTVADKPVPRKHERRRSQMPSFEGIWNIRDLGGLAGDGGKYVRHGLLFRAAALDEATDTDCRHLAGLGVTRIFDLRANRERPIEPPPCQRHINIMPWTRDYSANAGDLRKELAGREPSAKAMHAAMMDAYRRIAQEQMPALAAIFGALAQGGTPLLFHCAVGKDRTGVVAALLLALLGVAPDAIRADYLQTNAHMPKIEAMLRKHPLLYTDNAVAPGILTPLVRADADYLDAMFGTIRASHGSTQAFLETVPGIDAAMIARIRAHLLE